MDYGILIAALKVKPYLTDLEKDILVRGMKSESTLTVSLRKGKLYKTL